MQFLLAGEAIQVLSGGGLPLCHDLYQTISSKTARWSLAVGRWGAGGSPVAVGTAMWGQHRSLAGDVAPSRSRQLGSGAAAATPEQTLWSKVQETCSHGERSPWWQRWCCAGGAGGAQLPGWTQEGTALGAALRAGDALRWIFSRAGSKGGLKAGVIIPT